jgi:uncharacterized ferritin-like protein (DUF455 family)
MAGKGSLNNQRGKAKFMKVFFIFDTSLPYNNLYNSMPTAPTTIAVVVAIAGIIFPAINLTLNLSTSGIL